MPSPGETLSLNKKALLDAGRGTAVRFLELGDPGTDDPKTATAEDSSVILIVDGKAQDSGKNPKRDAEALLKRSGHDPFLGNTLLYGLGSPALAELLLSKGRLTAFEPRAKVARAFFSINDLSGPMAEGKLEFLTPWDLREGKKPPFPANLVIHPPSRGRDPGLCLALVSKMKERTVKRPEVPKILIIPPFSGGTLSMGPFLKRAGDLLETETALLAFSPKLVSESFELRKPENLSPEGEPKAPETASLAKNLFSKALGETKAALSSFKPHLVLALAQAPLDLPSLAELKDSFPDAIFSYWFPEDILRFRYIESLIPALDLFFHIQGPLMEETLRNRGQKNGFYLPPAADADFFGPRTVPPDYRRSVSFMGAGYPNRLRVFGELAENPEKWTTGGRGGFAIYGSGWEKAGPAVKKLLFDGGRRITTAETALIYAGTSVNLNIHSGDGPGFSPESFFVNPRTFEIAASGAFQIVDERPLLGDLFAEDELAVARDPSELPDLIDRGLRNPDLATETGRKARLRVLEEHLYAHRLKTVLKLAFPRTDPA
ncbi:MAG: glycosyltransferase [Deltaproteobacteria bacterium]|nr:glycosyltransferase [Deltaproteobacteria bacterium]